VKNNNIDIRTIDSKERQRIAAISATSSMDPTPLIISRESSTAGGCSGVRPRWTPAAIAVSPMNDTDDLNFAATAWPPIASLGDEETEEEDEEGVGPGCSIYSAERSPSMEASGSPSNSMGQYEPRELMARTATSLQAPTPAATRRPSTHD
jgi:hypothetical protein